MPHSDEYFMQEATKYAAQSPIRRPEDPLVGAVLARDGELLGAAHRSMRGDHAEFTLLQKEIRSRDVTAGTTLYTTLEPCTTRGHDKLPCAEWIVTKGIRRVVIGILDPNPSICGRGYWHLVDQGITVDFFPYDIARAIIDLNRGFVEAQRRPIVMTPAFASAVHRAKEPRIAPYGGIGWGPNLALQTCPNLREGWPLDQVELTLESETPFALSDDQKANYREYFAAHYEDKRFKDDGEKFAITQNPIAFTDAQTLRLTVRPTRYSVAHFYGDSVASSSTRAAPLVDDLIRGSLDVRFPNRMSMHLIVVTADHHLLLTRRSPKTDLFPQTWSISIEEQLSRVDLINPDRFSPVRWAERALREELGIDQAAIHKDLLRVLSVFLESHVLNISLCVYAEIGLRAYDLDLQLRGLPRNDFEFQEWLFIELKRDNVLNELFRPSRTYHPTSDYRLLSLFLKQFGVPTDAEIAQFTPGGA